MNYSFPKIYFISFLLLATLFSQHSFAQTKQLNIRKLSIQRGESKIEFPIVNLYKNQVASKKLNEFLQIDIAERTLAQCKEEDLFNQILFNFSDSNQHGFLENLEYETRTQNQALLSLTFWGSTMAAYPDYFESAYNFNAATGDILYLEDLCTQDGIKKLKEEVRNKRLKKINAHVINLKNDPEFKAEFESDDVDFIENLFSECMSYPTYNDFFIKNDSIHFQSPRCLPHAYQAMNGNFAVSIPLKNIEPFLNSYGKKILILHQAVPEAYHASMLKRPLYGSIGNTPIVLYLDAPTETINGFYYYASQGIRIDFFGSVQDNSIKVQCNSTYDSHVDESIHATLSKQGLNGTWFNANKKLPISVK